MFPLITMQMQITPAFLQHTSCQQPADMSQLGMSTAMCSQQPTQLLIKTHTWHIRRFDVPGSLQSQVDVLHQLQHSLLVFLQALLSSCTTCQRACMQTCLTWALLRVPCPLLASQHPGRQNLSAEHAWFVNHCPSACPDVQPWHQRRPWFVQAVTVVPTLCKYIWW